MGLIDPSGKPLKMKPTQPPKAGHDLVECSVLVSDLDQLKVTLPMRIQTPQGSMQVDVQNVLTSIAMNIYNVMKHSKQKEIIIRIADLSSELVGDKNLTMQVMQLIPPDLLKEEEDENGTEETKTEG